RACEAGDSRMSRQTLSPTSRASIVFGTLTWGSATLHPRLYAITCSAGWESKKMPRESPRGISLEDTIQRTLVTSAEDSAKNTAGTSVTTVSIAGILPVALVITLHKPLTESLGPRVP